MTVMSRNNYVGQQRLDLTDLLASESFTAFDFRALVSSFIGVDNAYVLRGLEIIGKAGLTVQVNVADALTFNPQDGNGSFYLGLPDDDAFSLTLPANQTNIYIEAKFINESQAPISKAFWDPLALTGDTASGTEFSSATDSQIITVLSITSNTIGFSEGAIPVARASTSTSSVTTLTDCRPLMWRLGTGGNSPNPLAKFAWSSSRGESVISGPGVGDSVDSSWRARDSVGALNDKGIRTQKEWADAVMTRIAEIAGTSLWYQTSSSSGSASNTSVSQLFFDTLGSHIQPSDNATFIWHRVGGNLVFGSQGFESGSGPYSEGIVKWRSNNSGLEWQVGGTFDTTGETRSYETGLYNFQSPVPADNGNVYLSLEREVPKGSGANVLWKNNISYAGFLPDNCVSGVPGDFIGIAIGDYIRKESEGYSRYYRISAMYDGSEVTTQNYIATSSVIALQVDNLTNPSVGISGTASSEPLRYFRSRYSNADVVADSADETYNFQDANFLWLGRRVGNLFILKDYGTMQENEEVPILNDSFQDGSGGMSDIVTRHAVKAYYDETNGYDLKTGSGTLLTLYRRKRNNTVSVPSSGDNSDALLTYIIDAPVGTLTSGQSLWVRLSDSTSGTLVAGSVVNSTNDSTNIDTTTNVYEILDAENAPLRTYDNRDVFLLARKEVIEGQESLVFFDGSVLGPFGVTVYNDLEIYGNLKLTQVPATAILFMDDTIAGQVDGEPDNLFYDKTNGVFGVQNFRISGSEIQLGEATNVNFLSNLGSGTVVVGGASSTTYIPGDLIVAGNIVGVQISELLVEDKLITLAVGDELNGGYNSGIEVADNTYVADTLSTVSASPDVDIDLGVLPSGYSIGVIVGVTTSDSIGGITGGQISGKYEIVSSLTGVGQAVISGTVLTVRTNNNATSSVSGQSTTSTKTFITPWSFKVTGSDGSLTDYSSWAFQVKGVTTTPTLTPINDYGIVPTAHSVNMQSGRIAFVNDDNAGPSGADTTLNFSSNLVWDNDSDTLLIGGNIAYSGFIDWTQLSIFPSQPGNGFTRVFAEDDYYIYQRTPDGNIQLLTQGSGNVYNEEVDVIASPSGNNQTAPISNPPSTIVIPKDSKKFLGTGLLASVNNGSSTVIVKKRNHGMVSGETVTVNTATDIGGIVAADLSVIASIVTVTDFETFSYEAGSNASSDEVGNLDKVICSSVRYYTVGDDSLEIYLNNVKLTKGSDYVEAGSLGSTSNTITFNINLISGDKLIYRIDANGGLVIINNGSSTSLQGSYLAGSTITVSTGNPVTITGSGGKLLTVLGDVDITGVIDPLGITFTQTASNPLGSNHGLWVNNDGDLVFERAGDSAQNISSAIEGAVASSVNIQLINNTGSTLVEGTPVSVNSSGELQVIDVANENNSFAIVGIVLSDIVNSMSGTIISSGRIEDITTSANFGDTLFVSKSGSLTTTKPSIGVGGFTSGDFVIRIGVISKNLSNATKKDIIVGIQVIGQL